MNEQMKVIQWWMDGWINEWNKENKNENKSDLVMNDWINEGKWMTE